jgi:hypothetical protein
VFLSATEISKTDFFSFFQRFFDKTFTLELCKSAFQKTGLILYNPLVVLRKMKQFGGIQENIREKELSKDEEPAFATLPPPDWTQFNTPITNTQRKRGSEYVRSRAITRPLTPTAIRVIEKVEKASDKLILQGQLATEMLKATNSAAARRQARKEGSSKIVQKYREIYGYQARRQIAEDEEDEKKVVNMREKRLQDPWKKKYKAIIVKFPKIYSTIRSKGYFLSCGTIIELGLDL